MATLLIPNKIDTEDLLNDMLIRGAKDLLSAAGFTNMALDSVNDYSIRMEPFAFRLQISDYSLAVHDHAEKVKELLPNFKVSVTNGIIYCKPKSNS